MSSNQNSKAQIDTNTNGNKANNNKTTKTNSTKTGKNNESLQVDFAARNQRGVQLNQRPTTSVSAKLGANKKHQESDRVIQEKPWTIDDILQRFKFVSTFKVPTTDLSHTILAKFRIPHDLIDTGDPCSGMQAPFQSFLFWNGDIHIHSQMTASPTVQGCVMSVFVPLTSEECIESTLVPNFSALSVNQCNYLFPNTNTSADMIIKYNSPYSNLNIQEATTVLQENTLGYLYYVVLNPIQLSQSSSNNIAISVFTHFEENKFKVPRMAGVTQRFKPKAIGQSQPVGTPQPVSAGLVSSIVDKVLPDNVIGDVIDAAAGIFGLDNPTISKIQEPSKVVSTQYMNFHTGAEHLDKMTINPSATTPITADTFATTNDEMSYKHLYSKFSYLGSFGVSTNDGIGKVVASYPMNPCPTRISNGTVAQVSLLQYLSTLFEFWNGALTYRFQIVSTMMQTCKLMVGLNYGKFTPDTTGLLQRISSQYGQVMEINQGSNVIDITVDYIAGTPMLHVPSSNMPSKYDTMGMVNIAVLNPLVATTGAPNEIFINVFIAGSENFNLTTLTASKNLQPWLPLRLPNPIKKKKKVHVTYESDSDDIEVIEVPKTTRVKIRGQSASQPVITPQSEIDTIDEENLVSKSETSIPRKPTAQVYVPGVREVMKKYQMYDTIHVPAVSMENQSGVYRLRLYDLFGRSGYPASGTLTPTSTLRPPLGSFTHYQCMYRLFKGGFNFKMVARSFHHALQPVNFSIFYQPPVYPDDGLLPTDLTETIKNQVYRSSNDSIDLNARTRFQFPYLTRLPVHFVNGITKTAEFTVPFSSRFLSVISSLGVNSEIELSRSEIADLGDVYIVYNTPASSGGQNLDTVFDVFFSISDDARFGTLFNVPQLATYSYLKEDGSVFSSPEPDNYGTGAPVSNTLIIL